MRGLPLIALATASFALSGCLAKTALDVATAPVKIASKAVDLATTSQSEADQKRGREIRQREERLGKLQRTYEKQLKQCHDGSRAACSDAQGTYAEIQLLLPGVPVEADAGPRR